MLDASYELDIANFQEELFSGKHMCTQLHSGAGTGESIMSNRNTAISDLEPLLIQLGDLPPGFSGAQVREKAPGMFSELPKPEKAISQQLARKDKLAGGITVLLYAESSAASKAFSLIVKGFGPGGENDLFKRAVHSLDNIGEKCTLSTRQPKNPDLLGVPLDNSSDLVFVRCCGVIHIRMVGTAEPDDIASYAVRLDRRLMQVICM